MSTMKRITLAALLAFPAAPVPAQRVAYIDSGDAISIAAYSNFLRNCLQGTFLSRYHPSLEIASVSNDSLVLKLSQLNVDATTQLQRANALLPTAWATTTVFNASGDDSNLTVNLAGQNAGFFRVFCPGSP